MQEHISQKPYIFFIIVNILVIKSTCFKMVTACYYAHNACKQIGKDYTVTYGECLDNKCTDPEWTIFSSSDKKKVVEFNGNVVYNNMNSSLKIQFVYNDSDDYWALSYMALNGTAMDSNSAALLLNYLCSDYFN